jgi:hypothetical protein
MVNYPVNKMSKMQTAGNNKKGEEVAEGSVRGLGWEGESQVQVERVETLDTNAITDGSWIAHTNGC